MAREIGTLTYRSGPEWMERFGRSRIKDDVPRLDEDFQVESYLAYQGDRFCLQYDANSYLYISKAMDLFDLGEGFASFEDGVGRIKARALVVGVPTDLLFPIALQEELAEALTERGRDTTFRVLDSIYGHDSFLVEIDALTGILREFLGASR